MSSLRHSRALPVRLAGVVHAIALIAGCNTNAAPPLGVAPTHPPVGGDQRRAGPTPNADYEIVVAAAELRPGVTADLTITVFVNEAEPCRSPERTMIAMHGATHTAQMFRPLAAELFRRTDRPLCRLAALELPGQGRNPLPRGVLYGELGLDDMTAAMIAQLDALKARNYHSRTLIAHSRGTLLTQYVQQFLLSRETSLRQEYGIDKVVLLNGFGGGNTPWFSRDVLHVWENATANAIFHSERGWIIPAPEETWLAFWFRNLDNEFHPQTPSPTEVVTAGYITDEPLQFSIESAMPGPVISANIFDPMHGTTLFMVSGTNDFASTPGETMEIYRHLTGDVSHGGVAVIDDRFAVHSQLMADPAGYLAAIAPRVMLP